MFKALDHDFIFVTFLIDVAYRGFGKRTGCDQTLFFTINGHIRGSWHVRAPNYCSMPELAFGTD